MGAIKAALTAIFNAHGDNDFGSTSKVPYFDSSNNPYGMATPAKLASVLGENMLNSNNANKIAANTALSSYTKTGFYVCNDAAITATITDKPVDLNNNRGFNMLNMSPYGDSGYGFQVIFQYNYFFLRYNNGSSSSPSYSSWRTFWGVDIKESSPLGDQYSSALRTWKYQNFLTSTNLPSGTFASMRGAGLNGLWGFSSTNTTPSDAPSGVTDGLVYHSDLYENISIQIIIKRGGGMLSRVYWYGTWSSWA